MYILAKFIITSLIIVGASELAKRYTAVSAVLISLPITSILTFIWVYYETENRKKLISMSNELVVLVLPSISFFVIFSYMLSKEKSFASSMGASIFGTVIFYWLFIKLKGMV